MSETKTEEPKNYRNIKIEDTYRGAGSQRIEGKKFYMLTAKKYLGRAYHRVQMNAVYLWECECGIEMMEFSKEVRGGRTKSCGCHVKRRGQGPASNPRAEMWKNFYKGTPTEESHGS